ncbi:unnamed protein product [Candidula unifasciata]|uniref:Metalloendopeptidase OMA1, mitochondrial n=1 Tax=Candidula unifasciata TaxID=100452 RepID=A0A8S3YHS2_9EUPU|nr:unnamed protein product [Candidula unifasciata]
MQRWTSFIRPLLSDLRFSAAKSETVSIYGLLTCRHTGLGLTGSSNLRTSNRNQLLQTAQTFIRRQQWGTYQTRVFHTSSRRPIHPVLWIFLKPLAKFSAVLTGRSLRIWFRSLKPAQRKKIWAAVKRHWYISAGVPAALAASAGIYYVSHIEETPVTGRKRFIALTHDQIVKIAQAEATQLIEIYGTKQHAPNDPQSLRVLQVARRLLSANPELRKMQFREWQIYVIKDPLVNACVLPSGHMFVFDGILEVASTQDQLAIILGHEMAHAVLEHGVEELSLGKFVDVFVIFCLAAIWCIMPFDGIALLTHWFYDRVIQLLTHMPHSRKLEKEADKVGLLFAARACYDTRQGSVLWTKMSYNEKLGDSASNLLPEWMQTHPDSLKRAHYLDFLEPEAEKWREENRCPKLPPGDPREAVKVLSQHIDNIVIANKSGQDLRRVQRQPGLVTVKNS